jgi:hypothetical protein
MEETLLIPEEEVNHPLPRKKEPKFDMEKGISDIVGVFFDPIVVFPGGWEDTIPPWIKEAITTERLIENIRALREGDMTATDAEACAYLYTLSLCQMPEHDWVTIYQYLVTKVSERHKKGIQIPDDIKVDELSYYQKHLLQKLKGDIYNSRIKHRKEKRRAEKREVKEQQEQTTFTFEEYLEGGD